MKKVTLKRGKTDSIDRHHHWIFSGAIQKADQGIKDGEQVEIFDFENNFCGIGHYQNHSSISVRMISKYKINSIAEFYFEILKDSLEKRLKIIDFTQTNCYRLVHGEGDFIPGLIVDIYDQCAVIQAHSSGIGEDLGIICEALNDLYYNKLVNIYCKNKFTSTNASKDNLNYFFKGNQSETIVQENGIKFLVNWVKGQKTGFFIDQRDNRNILKSISKNQRVLNTFCYSGGFSLYAFLGGAKEVCSVDDSQYALDCLSKNLLENNIDISHHNAIKADVPKWLNQVEPSYYQVIIVDPPAFAKSHAARHRASLAYRRLNSQALTKVAKGGHILTFSCSQAISTVLFRSIILSAALESGRKVQILQTLSQGFDHPINIYHPESEYLKGLLLSVD